MFFDKKPDNAIGQPSFAVYVNRAELTLSIDIHSERLKSLLVDLKLLEAQCAIMPLYDLLLGYKSLTSSLTGLEKDGPSSQWNDCLSEIRLFASDFLLDRSIFATFGLENLYSLGLLDPSHWQDMERYATLRDMDEIDEAVGFVSDNDDNDNTDTPDGTELLDSATLLKIQHAIRYDDLSCVQRLLNGQFGQVDANTLDISLRRGQLEIFEALLYHGGIIDGDSSNFLSEPLYTATKRGHFDAVIALLKYGACVNGAGHRCSYTPLCGAASGGFLPIVELLHSYGADINGNHVKTPLVAAAKHGHISVVQYLWDNGADINRETSCYGSAITVAVEHRQYGVIKYLVERGADVNLRPNLDGSSWLSDRLPLTAAVKYSDYEMSKFLLNSGATCEELDLRVALKAACKSRQSEIALELFSYGAAMGDIEKNYLLSCSWKLLHSCTDPRKALELASLHYRIQQQPAISTPMSWYDHLSFIYNGNSDRLFCYEIYETNRIWPPTDFERKAQLWHAIQQREPECRQRTMGIRLRRAFAAIYGRLLKRSTELSTSEAFASFVLKFGSAATAWKKGTFAIRKLIDRCVPQSLSEVISCLLVADAIKTVNMLNKSFQTREEALCQ
jgi:ankyrin repeat protein